MDEEGGATTVFVFEILRCVLAEFDLVIHILIYFIRFFERAVKDVITNIITCIL